MYGKSRTRDTGQLAVLDAVVFFSSALVISSLLLYYGLGQGSPVIIEKIAEDPSEILAVYLRASLGTTVLLPGNPEVVVRETDTVGDCLLAEASSLSRGDEPIRFSLLNSILCGALDSVCGLCVNPHLLVENVSDGAIVIALPDLPGEATDARAASMELEADGNIFLFELVLFV